VNAIEEIVEHHRFIEAWLSGTVTGGTTELAGFLGMHTPDFTWYDPDGSLAMLPDLSSAMEKAHGAVPGLQLHIREPRLLLDDNGLVAATYEEHQYAKHAHPKHGHDNARRAVAVFVPDPETRNGLRWRHLHETWIVAPSR
jgi:hypothetical protein